MGAGNWAVLATGLVVAMVAVSWFRTRRQVVRRLGAVVARLDERPDPVASGGGSFDAALSRLERTVDRSNTRLSDTQNELQRVAAVLDLLAEGVIVVNATGRVVLRNAAAAEFVDARHGEAVAEATIRDVIGEALRGVDVEREVELFGPPRRSLMVSSLALGGAGGAMGAAALIRDVSDARRVDSVRRDFVANVSHELKTPIGALVALAETLEADDDPAVMRRLAVRVRHEAERLARIVSDLLDLSLIEAQEAPPRAAVPVEVLVEEAVDRVRSGAERAGVRLEVEPIAAGVSLVCDRRQVVSALFNLLDNAVKYVDREAQDGVVEVRFVVGDGRASFRVSDNGIGVPERDRARIFERFYRVDRARSRASGGTGLGLAIVRHVAQAHAGGVGLDSEEGSGSTFEMWFPADAVAQASRSPEGRGPA